MITISIRTNRRSCRAFTLVELMITLTISTIVIASILGTFLTFAKSSASVGEYAHMSQESRKALELFSRDVRAADGITVINALSSDGVVFSRTGLTLSFPDYYGPRTVKYRYLSANGILRRIETYDGTVRRSDVLTGVKRFQVKFFETPGENFESIPGPVASVNAWTKSLQLDAELLRKVLTIDNTDYIISARFMMRNAN